MTLKEENYQNFKNAFEKEVQKTIHPDLLIPEISVDAEINFSDINPKLIRLLSQFEPFGPQNMTPIFITKNIKDTGYAKPLGQNDEHLKLFVKQSRNFGTEGFGAIGFGLGNKIELTKNQKPFEAVYCIDENEYNGSITIQLRVKDLKE
jgi:single-stranded-DNA-specific exonuclease